MKNNKGKIIIIISIIVILLLITIFVLFFTNNEDNDIVDNKLNDNINKEFIRLDNDKLFDIQSTINNFYEIIAVSSNDDLYKILDSEYIKENQITKDNVIEKFVDYQDSNYYAEKIYYNNDDHITYYFVSGYRYGSTSADRIYHANYLVIIKNNNYMLRPLDNNIEIENIINNYNIVDRNVPKNAVIKSNIKEKNKLVSYIANFMNLYNIDKEKAYSMVGNDTKIQYNGFNDFSNRGLVITSTIFAMSKEEKDNTTIYNIKDNSQNNIEIIEYYPNDYMINFDISNNITEDDENDY